MTHRQPSSYPVINLASSEQAISHLLLSIFTTISSIIEWCFHWSRPVEASLLYYYRCRRTGNIQQLYSQKGAGTEQFFGILPLCEVETFDREAIGVWLCSDHHHHHQTVVGVISLCSRTNFWFCLWPPSHAFAHSGLQMLPVFHFWCWLRWNSSATVKDHNGTLIYDTSINWKLKKLYYISSDFDELWWRYRYSTCVHMAKTSSPSFIKIGWKTKSFVRSPFNGCYQLRFYSGHYVVPIN